MGEIPLLQTLHALVQMLHRQHDAPQKQHRKQRVRAQHRGHRLREEQRLSLIHI